MVKAYNKTAILVCAKVPGYGSAKSRIAAVAGEAYAEIIYNHLLYETAALVRPYPCHVAFTGSSQPEKLTAVFNSAISFFAQTGNSLGDRLRNAFTCLFYDLHYDYAVAIGVDCPYLRQRHLAVAIRRLKSGIDVVIGPATDGGYYLIGCNHDALSVFSATQWSMSGLLAETMSIVRFNNLSHYLLEKLSDIDFLEDYLIWKKSQS